MHHRKPTVGASLLAMVVNDDVGGLAPRGALRFIASKLAPTVGLWCFEGQIPGIKKAPRRVLFLSLEA
ncbi:hypothetical protein C1X61_08465 [Pseudomonas sp. FW215-T2]|nr:hypothetical protein C1X61_08465 [Pseudomonas sp. FW215-T2]PNA13277.1 hypothetical protein C1X62_10815 [Pseudomonas sp. FW215-R3]PNB37964.1 hypothetical protein C1X63_09750 [Pseudomonas sp. FW305-131]